MSNRLKFRKYLVLAACFLIMAVSFSIINNITSLFIDPVTKHLRLSISSFSFVFTIGAITTALMSPIIGQLISKVPLKAIMSLGAILAGGGFFCYSLATQIWMFYVIAVIVGIGTSCLTVIPISTADIEELECLVCRTCQNARNQCMLEFHLCIGHENIQCREHHPCQHKRYEAD